MATIAVSNEQSDGDAGTVSTTDASEIDVVDHVSVKDLKPDFIFRCVITGSGSTARLKVYASQGKKGESKPSIATLDANQVEIATADVVASNTKDFVVKDGYDFLKLTVARVGGTDTTVKAFLTGRGNEGA
jgi:hypothetical protein